MTASREDWEAYRKVIVDDIAPSEDALRSIRDVQTQMESWGPLAGTELEIFNMQAEIIKSKESNLAKMYEWKALTYEQYLEANP